jgi:hypothetical protein
MNVELDSYVLRARLWPALIASSPVVFALIAVVSLDWKEWQVIGGCVVFLGLLGILEHLGRERGFQLQPTLFDLWGGAPTTRYLRHRDSTLNSVTKNRYRNALAALVPVADMPTAESESQDPQAADRLYESCGQYLRARTRKKDDHPLVFAKNVEYGFRRNCLGVRTPAIWLGSASLLAVTIRPIIASPMARSALPIALVSGFAVCLLLIWWTKTVTAEWVRSSADAYAEALLGTCDQLEKPSSRDQANAR